MSSELPLKADIAQYSRHVSKVPHPDMCQLLDHLVGRRLQGRGHGYAELQHQGSFPSQDGFSFFWGGHQLRETPHIQRR